MLTTTAILLLASGIIAGLLLIVAVAPVTFSAYFTVTTTRQKGLLHAQWLHPAVARVEYDPEQGRVEIGILGWSRLFSGARTAGIQAEAQFSPQDTAMNPVEASAPETHLLPHAKKGGAADDTKEAPPSGSSASAEKTDLRKSAAVWQKVKRFVSFLKDRRNQRVAAKTLRWCRRTVRLFFSAVSLHWLRLYGKIGTDDPAETGTIFGCYTALDRGCFSLHKNVDVRFTPIFSGDLFECDGTVALRTSGVRMAFLLFAAVVTFPYLTAYFVWRRVKEKA